MRRKLIGRVCSAAGALAASAAVIAALGSGAGAASTIATTSTTTTSSSTTVTTTSTTTSTTTAPKPKPKPKPKPRTAHSRLYLPDAFFVHGDAVTIPGRMVHVHGVVFPWVKNQHVIVRVYVNHRLVKRVRLRLWPSKRHLFGQFTYGVTSPRVGDVGVVVEHHTSPKLKYFNVARKYQALDPNITWGSTGRFVQLIQQQLAKLHFYIPQSGVYDQGTGLAVDAYHRLLTWGTWQTLDGKTISYLLNGWGEFKVRFPSHGIHAEGNLRLQLLALTNGSHVRYIFPISSGKPSTPTILGSFRVYSRVPGYLPDGMYYSNFFYGGYAIHGYDPAPDYPASHGCMRLPIVDAIFVYNWLNYGDGVDTYY